MTPQTKNKGGQAPYGFRWYEGEFIHEPEEAKICALIFDLFLMYQRKQTVARFINAQGFRTSNGCEFSHATIKRILKSSFAKGIHRTCTTKAGADGGNHEVVEKPVPPIVSETVWNHVQAILKEQAGTQSRSPTQDIFIGKVFCSCSNLMELPSKSPDYKCPGCAQTMSIDDVWAIVQNRITALALPSEDVLTKTATTAILDIKNNPEPLLKRVNRDMDKLFSLHAKDAISDDIFKERHSPLAVCKVQLEAAIKNQKNAKPPTSFIDSWQELTPEMKRIVVENLIDDIVVSPTKATVSLYPLFNFAQQVTTTPA